MSNITHLDELVPNDIVFEFDGKQYTAPGDPLVPLVYKLLRVYNDANLIQTRGLDDDGQVVDMEQMASLDEKEAADGSIQQVLLELFQQRMPDLEALPFGQTAFQAVLRRLLLAYGLLVIVDPPKPRPKQEKRTVPRSRRSR